jgi:Flp pilus assembly protein TadG
LKRLAIGCGQENGQAVLLVVVAMGIVLIGALGLAIDGGQMYAQQQMAQAAADSAAQAGIMSIRSGTNATAAFPFGTGATPIASSVCATGDQRTPCVYARHNGFGGTAADTVTMSFPASVSGVTLSSATVPAFTVTVQRSLKNGLIRFLGAAATSTIKARATAGLVTGVSPNCIYALDPSAQNAFQATNGATVALTGCSIAVNSSHATAAIVNGNSVVQASAMKVVGGVVIDGGGSVTPAPFTGVAPAVDPFASAPSPVAGACDFTNYNPGWGTWTLNPGTYCGGIRISNGATATFNPGTYIVKGGGVTFIGGTTITGSGLMFYLTGTNATYASATISNGAIVTFSAQTSGPYMGILFYQDRSITSASNATFSGGVTMQLSGSLYFPTTSVLYSNGSNTAVYTGIVAKRVAFLGGTSVKYDATGSKTGLFVKAVALVQ